MVLNYSKLTSLWQTSIENYCVEMDCGLKGNITFNINRLVHVIEVLKLTIHFSTNVTTSLKRTPDLADRSQTLQPKSY